MEFRGGLAGSGRFGGIRRARRAERRARRAGLRLGMERLEERVVLSTSTWSGAAAIASGNDNWSDAGNWDVAPTAGSDLVFPTGLSGAALTSNDDISGGQFGSLTIGGSGYTIASTQGDGVALAGSIDASQTSGSSTLNLPVDFGKQAATITVDNSGAALAMGDAVAGGAGVTKLGSGVLDLQGTNVYTGDTTVTDGALLVDGTVPGAVAVGSGATVGGVGTVGSITTTAATVSPGDSSAITGVLTDTGALTLDSSSNFDVTINGTTSGTQYDQLNAGGPINLAGATLNISTGSFDPAPGDSFTIIHNTSGQAITGTFANLAEQGVVTADGHDFIITYKGGSDGQDVVLTVKTPPSVTWTGTDASLTTNPNDNWSDGNNWQGGKPPVAGDAIIFPTNVTGAALTSNNDIPNTIFDSISIALSNYTITGDGVGLSDSTPLDASQSSGPSTIALPITFNAGVTTVNVEQSGASLLLTGVVSSPSGVTKQGSGTLNLVGDDGTLPVAIDAGDVLVDGSAGDVSANSGTLIGGSGSVTEISASTATVSPGDSSTVTGVLTDSGDLVLGTSSTFDATLNGTTAGTGYDQVSAGGVITLTGATLTVALGPSFPTNSGQQYTIIHNTGGQAITGTFANLAEGATLSVSNRSFKITYKGGTDDQDVVLTSLLSTTTTANVVTSRPVTGQSVELTATVAPATGTGTPTGTVSFSSVLNGTTTSLGTATVNSSGLATLDTTQLTTGTNEITATYSGDTTYAGSASAAVAAVVSQASTTTTLTATPNPSVVGQPVTLMATVAPQSPGSGTPTGTVTFTMGSTTVGTGSLAGGVATYTTTNLPAGTDAITASYGADTNFAASTSSAYNVVIGEGSTNVTISTTNPNPYALQPDTFTAVVSAATGLGTPTGTVTFETANGTVLGTSTLSSGSAAFTANVLPVGAQTIKAVYSGDSSFVAASSQPLSLVVGHRTDLFVNQVYLDVFGSPADQGATLWIALINGGFSPKRVARYILESKPAKVSAVEHVYESLLDRPATSTELKRALASGSTSTTPLSINVFGSNEYFQTRGHDTNAGFLSALAQDWFGSPFPTAVQSKLAGELARGVSRTKVARQVVTSPSGVDAQVNSIFEDVLERPATAKEEKQFAPLVRQGNLVSVYDTLFASQEFKTKFVDIGAP